MRVVRSSFVAMAAAGLMMGVTMAGPASAAAPQVASIIDSTGRVTAITPQQPVPSPAGAGLAAAGKAHIAKLTQWFHTKVGTLDVTAATPSPSGGTVRLQQRIDGVPVLGAQVVQVLDTSGALVTAHGRTAQRTVGAFPADAAAAKDRARQAAVARAAAATGRDASALQVESLRAYWYDATLLGGSGKQRAVPAYQVIVTEPAGQETGVLVRAENAKVLTSWSNTHTINRIVCDADGTVVNLQDKKAIRCGTAFEPARVEGGSPSKVDDVNAVYNYFGDTSTFYAENTGGTDLTQMIGADYGDGNGKALRATVRICVSGVCPYTNAFWNGEQMAFGQGITTDDVTAHELTHGVTEHVNGLVYKGQAGAINESMSDVFAEFVDMSNGSDDDTKANRWQIGEGSSLGTIRDLADPTQFEDPGKMSSQYYYTGGDNSAYVHTNSGVGNHTAYLIAAGGSFNGQDITGIGLEKTYTLYWTVQHQLSSSADYAELGSVLNSACQANVRGSVAGTTAADCEQVGKVVKATELLSGAKLTRS